MIFQCHMILQKSYTYSTEVFKKKILILKLINIFLKAVILFLLLFRNLGWFENQKVLFEYLKKIATM